MHGMHNNQFQLLSVPAASFHSLSLLLQRNPWQFVTLINVKWMQEFKGIGKSHNGTIIQGFFKNMIIKQIIY